ncbi:MAG TPA: hypothetical protein VD791_10425 [Burkholderiales bacterium]|nr:hypothetical protein [Burkholderiales bacterium]
MRRIALLCAGLLLSPAIGAQVDGTKTQPAAGGQPTAVPAAGANSLSERSAPLVRELEARYKQSMQAARRGDVEAYWSMRTAASRTRPPQLDTARLRLLADLLPPLEALHFVRVDTTGKTARALYRWRKEDVAQYSVITYRMEGGEWKIDDVSVRRGGSTAGAPVVSAPPQPADPPASARPGAPASGSQAQELLKAWESGESATGRSLSAPRL